MDYDRRSWLAAEMDGLELHGVRQGAFETVGNKDTNSHTYSNARRNRFGIIGGPRRTSTA